MQLPYPYSFVLLSYSSYIGNRKTRSTQLAAERLSGDDVIPLRKRDGGLVARVCFQRKLVGDLYVR